MIETTEAPACLPDRLITILHSFASAKTVDAFAALLAPALRQSPPVTVKRAHLRTTFLGPRDVHPTDTDRVPRLNLACGHEVVSKRNELRSAGIGRCF